MLPAGQGFVCRFGSDKELKEHLQDCPSCRQFRETWPNGLSINSPDCDVDSEKNPQPGELWGISTKMRGWGEKNRYYNPPVVLITGTIADYGFAVVQIYDDILLASQDDVLLLGPDDGELIGFAQPWNRYSLHRGNLDICLGRVTESCLHAVTCLLEVGKAMEQEQKTAPKQGSLLWFFRNMEVETGWYFSRQAMGDLMDSYGAAEQADNGITLSYLRTRLAGQPVIMPDIVFDESDLESFLCAVVPDDGLLALAAADTRSEESVQALLFLTGSDEHVRVKTVTCEIKTSIMDGYLRVSGSSEENPGDNCEWFFRWSGKDWFIKSIAEESGWEGGVFWTAFPADELPDNGKGELHVRILVHKP